MGRPADYVKFPDPNPSGVCLCGCRRETNTIRGGRHKEYIHGHNRPEGVGRKPGSAIYDWLAPRSGAWVAEERGHDTPCWVWKKAKARGEMYYGPHKRAWRFKNGPVPEGLELDHLCRVRACINPDHLEPVTHQENARRGVMATTTAEQVRAVYEQSGSHSEVGRILSINRKTVAAIRRGEYDWRLV